MDSKGDYNKEPFSSLEKVPGSVELEARGDHQVERPPLFKYHIWRSLCRYLIMLSKFLVVAGFVVFSAEAFSFRDLFKRDYSNTLQPLQFKKDGTFQLAIFEDLHFGESMHARFPFLPDTTLPSLVHSCKPFRRSS